MQEKIIQYIKTEIIGDATAELLADDDLLNSGLIDSMSVMRMIAFIEEEFGVKIPPQDMVIEHFLTVDAIAGYLQHAKASE